MRTGIGRLSIAAFLCLFLAATTAIPTAVADNRKNSRHDNDWHHYHGELHGLKELLAKLVKELDALKRRPGSNTAALEQKIADLTARVDQVKTNLDQVNTQVGNLVTANAQLTLRVARLEAGGGSPAPGGTAALAAFDGNNLKVGDVVGFHDGIPLAAVTARDASGQSFTFPVNVFPDELGGGNLWYSGENCTGTPFLEPVSAVLDVYIGPNAVAVGAVGPGAGVFFAAAPLADVTETQVRSQFMPDGSCMSMPMTVTHFVTPATRVTVATPFTPRYTVR